MLKESELERIGARVAFTQQQARTEPAIADVDRFLNSSATRTHIRRRRQIGVTALAVSAAAGVLAAGIVLHETDERSFTVDDDPGVVGSWLAASADNKLQVQFRDGANLELAPGGRARIIGASPQIVEALVEHGTVKVTTAGDPKAHWRLHAGPMSLAGFDVDFTLTWNAVTEVFEAVVHRGACRATNGSGETHNLEAGQYLRVSVTDGRSLLSDAEDRFQLRDSAGTSTRPRTAGAAPTPALARD